MRYTIRDILGANDSDTPLERLRSWWVEWPPRTTVTRDWRLVLFEPGQGWLRWKPEHREDRGPTYFDPPEPPDTYTVAPPFRRLWWTLAILRYGGPSREDWRLLVDDDRRALWK